MEALKLVHTTELNREEWLKWRDKGIGSSDAAVVAGINPYKSAVTLWLEKTGQITQDEANERMEIGTEIEDWIARKFVRQYKKDTGIEAKIQNSNYILQHKKHSYMLANLDRLVYIKDKGWGVLECKNTSEYMKGEWDMDKMPDMYYLQVQHQLAVTGYKWGYIAVLIGGNKFRYKYFERDEEIINYLIQIESDFWKLVEQKLMPVIDGSESTTKALQRLYQESTKDKVITLDAEADALLIDLERARATVKKAEEREKEIENKLKAIMGDAEIAFGIDGRPAITWKTTTSNRIDTDRLKKEKPDIYTAYCKQSTTRRFLPKFGG